MKQRFLVISLVSIVIWQIFLTILLFQRTQAPDLIVPISETKVTQGFKSGNLYFDMGRMMLIASGKDESLNAIYDKAGLSESSRVFTRSILVDYMEKANKLGVDENGEPSFYAYIELRNELLTRLKSELGETTLNTLTPAFEEHGLIPHYDPILNTDSKSVTVSEEPDFTYASAPLPFEQTQIEAVSASKAEWLEHFLSSQEGVNSEEIRQTIVSYMRQINQIDIMAYRGVHDKSQSASFRELENQRLKRTLDLTLDEQQSEELRSLMEKNNVLAN